MSMPLIPVDDTRNREGWVEGLLPIEDKESRILILGTMPGVESLIRQAYYANPRNLFWKMLSEVTGKPMPDTYEDKKEFLLRNKIALWDICRSCIRNGSLDSTISNEMPNDINRFVEEHPHLKVIGFNGKTSERLFRKHIEGITHVELISLPSTSPANAYISQEKKVEAWKKLKDHI